MSECTSCAGCSPTLSISEACERAFVAMQHYHRCVRRFAAAPGVVDDARRRAAMDAALRTCNASTRLWRVAVQMTGPVPSTPASRLDSRHVFERLADASAEAASAAANSESAFRAFGEREAASRADDVVCALALLSHAIEAHRA